MTDDELLALAKERVANDNGKRHSLDQAKLRVAADLAPSVLGEQIGHAVAVVLLDHSEAEHPDDPNVHELAYWVMFKSLDKTNELALLRTQVASLQDELDRLRPLHETPYADEEHQGGNLVDVVGQLLADKYKAERQFAELVVEFRESFKGAADAYADRSGAQVSPVQTPDRADDSVPTEPVDNEAIELGQHYGRHGREPGVPS